MKVNNVRVTKFYKDLPDVDLDFEPFGRDKVKEYIKQKYGFAYSCSVGTYTRMKLKTCIKDFAKVKGLPFDLTNKLTKDIDDQIEYVWGDLIEYASKSKALFKFVQEYPEIVHMTKYALLQCKAASVHPSAVIIVPKQDKQGNPVDVFSLMPVKMIDGILVSEWEGKYTEASLFLKEDILGLSQLTKFHTILDLIKKNKGKKIDVNKIPFDDSEVYKYFRRGWCEDVFQFGTMSLMNYSKQVKPTELSDLIAMSALFRPGPIASNAHQDFADIKNGKKKPKYDYGIKNITGETYSLLVYQEQMMSIIHQLGGLSLIEAENARKYIKKKMHNELDALGNRFIAGAIKNGCGEDEAKKIWDKMNAFSAYSFNKSHAAAYSVMSYWCQWFKVNYPLEFWTASLQEAAETDIPYRLSEMKKTGVDIEVRPADINKSEGNFTCDGDENRIFFSLNKIKGVGEVAVKNIMDTRNSGGQFYDFEEFLSRVPSKVNKTVVKCLIIAGAFDLIENLKQPRDRRKLLEHYLVDIKGEALPEEYDTNEAKTSNAFWTFEQKRLTGFGDVDYETMIKDAIPNKRIASLYVSGFDFFSTVKEGSEVTIAGKLIYFVERDIKNGKMCTINIDSNNDIIQCTLWPDAYEKIDEEMLDLKGRVICINGQMKKDKYKGQRVLYSTEKTKLYIVGETKQKFSRREEWKNSKS